jgi:dipeptidyl aminopeptidase/acylaminoacyl peptidase
MTPRRAPRIAAAAAAILAAAPGLTDRPGLAAPPSEARRSPWTADDILRLREVSDPQVSPDGRRVVFVVSEADEDENALNADLHLAPVGAAAAEPIRLTRSPKADRRPRWRPDGGLIAFLSGRPGSKPQGDDAAETGEKSDQLWLIRPDGGEPWQPAAIPGSVANCAWSPDGGVIALLVREAKSAERRKREKEKDDATVVDGEIRRDQVWLLDAATGRAVQVTRGAVHFTSLDWSPDGARLVLAGQPTPKVPDLFRSDLYTLELAQARAALREGRPDAAPVAEPAALVTTRGPDSDPRWSPDGTAIAFLTQDGNDEWYTNAYVAVVPAAGGTPRVLTRAFDEEAQAPRWSPDGRFILFEAAQRMARHLFRVPARGGGAEALTRGGDVHRSLSLSRDGRTAAFVHEGRMDPPEIFVATAGPKAPLASARPLARVNARADDHATLAKETFRFKGAGGMEMEGLLVRPAAPASGRPAPLLTIVHGGPAGVFSNVITVRRGVYPVQLFGQEGYAVFLPNPRGSGGYGEAFRKANVRDWGEKDYEDIMAGIDALAAAGVADPGRLGIMGWSYGGFMTSRAITKTKRFKAASVGAGVTDTVSFTGVADIPPFMRSYFGAWPWEDPEIYTSRTAVYNALGVSTPTLIQHGEDDARVPVSQGWELYVALKEQGVPVEFVTYPRQAHGIAEPRLIRDAMRRNLEWFRRFIPAGGGPG